MSKIYFLNWHNNHKGNYGPTQIFNNLTKNLEKDKDIEILCPETFNGSFNDLIKEIFFKYLPKKDKSIFVVNGEGLKLPFFMLLFSKIFRKHEYFLMYHGLREEEDKYSGISSPKYYYLERKILKNFPNIICVSSFLRNLIISRCKRSKKTYVINSGVNYSSIDKKSLEDNHDIKLTKEFKFIISGGIKKVKGIDKAINMIKAINSSQNEFIAILDIYGGYDDEAYYKDILNSIDKNSYINYKGEVPKEIINSLYKDYDFLVALSNFDSYNMTVLESVSSGTPVIISDNIGACDVIKDNNLGCILKSSDITSENFVDIINLLQEIYRNKDKYSIMINECLKAGKKYDWNIVKNSYINLFTKVKEGR